MAGIVSNSLSSTKHFCILPWTHLMVHQTGDIMACCRLGELAYSYGQVRSTSLDEIWNGSPIKGMRRHLLNDQPLPQCQLCYQEEAIGLESLRQRAFRMFPNVIDLVKGTAEDGSLSVSDIQYLGLRLSNNCNLRCRTCSPGNSASWYGDAEVVSGKRYSGILRPTRTEEDLWLFLDRLLPSVRHIYFAGGEPLLQKEHFLLLEKLIATGNTSVNLNYNTNLTSLRFGKWDVIDLWKHFPNILVGASLDGIDGPGELLRKGSNWADIEKNYLILRNKVPHACFCVIPTVSVMNAFHLPQAIDRWIEVGMVHKPDTLKLNFLQIPRYFNLNILNQEERTFLISTITHYLQSLSNRVDLELYRSIEAELHALINICNSDVFWEEERKQFRAVTFKLDRKRNERFIRLFPEYFNLLYGS